MMILWKREERGRKITRRRGFYGNDGDELRGTNFKFPTGINLESSAQPEKIVRKVFIPNNFKLIKSETGKKTMKYSNGLTA